MMADLDLGRGSTPSLLFLTSSRGFRRDIDGGRIVMVVFEDFTVAFNSLYCSAMVNAVIKAGFSHAAAKVIAHSLLDREFMVVCGDHSSSWRRVDRGIGQGGRLGPILYIITANHYPRLMTGGCRCHLLADDSTVELAVEPANILNGLDVLQTSLDAIQSWSAEVGLVMNPDKTVLVVFGSASSVAAAMSMDPTVMVSGRCLQPFSEVKYLSVWLKETLSWGRHARLLTSRAYNALRSLAHFRRALSLEARTLLVRSLSLVHLDYCSIVLSGVDFRCIRLLEVAQNACVRFITHLPWSSHVSEARRPIGFLSVTNRRRFKSLVL